MPTDTFIQAMTSSGSGVALLVLALFVFAASSFVALVALLERADRCRHQHREESRHADL